jgi:hypothetical protein
MGIQVGEPSSVPTTLQSISFQYLILLVQIQSTNQPKPVEMKQYIISFTAALASGLMAVQGKSFLPTMAPNILDLRSMQCRSDFL